MALTTDSEMDPTAPYQQFFSGFFLQKLLVMLDKIDASLTALENGAKRRDIRQIYHAAISDLHQKRDELEVELNHVVAEVCEQADPLMYPSRPESTALPGAARTDGWKQFIQTGLDEHDTVAPDRQVNAAGVLPGDDEHVSRARSLKTGTWLLFKEDDMPPYRACFAWHNRVTNIFYFINQHGHLLLEKTLDELAADLRERTAELVGHGPPKRQHRRR